MIREVWMLALCSEIFCSLAKISTFSLESVSLISSLLEKELVHCVEFWHNPRDLKL
jgi:fluoride ion exporter CrcB/FEX